MTVVNRQASALRARLAANLTRAREQLVNFFDPLTSEPVSSLQVAQPLSATAFALAPATVQTSSRYLINWILHFVTAVTTKQPNMNAVFTFASRLLVYKTKRSQKAPFTASRVLVPISPDAWLCGACDHDNSLQKRAPARKNRGCSLGRNARSIKRRLRPENRTECGNPRWRPNSGTTAPSTWPGWTNCCPRAFPWTSVPRTSCPGRCPCPVRKSG